MSVAQAVSEGIIEKLKGKRPKKIDIKMEVGKLRFHNTDQVEFWLNEILRKEFGDQLSVKADIKVIEPTIKCSCGYNGSVEDVHTDEEGSHHGIYEMKCPKCGSDEYELASGNECNIISVNVTE